MPKGKHIINNKQKRAAQWVMRIFFVFLDEDEYVEKALSFLIIWGDALQTITSPKPPSPPALKACLLYKGTDSNKGLTNGDYSNGILSFLALSPVPSFHLYIKIGLWILTKPTASSTRRLSWMKRERKTIMSWIR